MRSPALAPFFGLRFALPLCLAGCLGVRGPLPPGFESWFTSVAACDDLTLFANTAEDDVLLVFSEPDLVGAVVDAGSAATYSLAADDVATLDVYTGASLSNDLCGGEGEVYVDETYRAIGGSLTVDVRPPDEDEPRPRVDAQFSDVAFRHEATGEVLVVSDLSLRDVAVQSGT